MAAVFLVDFLITSKKWKTIKDFKYSNVIKTEFWNIDSALFII